MHLVYRGNAQLIMNRLFTSQSQKWSSIFGKSLLLELDCIVQNIRFPHYFDRKIPSLNTIGNFKASELKNMLVYAILPLTAPFMDEIPDYWHWIAIYVHAIKLLSQPVVSVKDADHAQLLLDVWQKLIPEFCHENAQNFNSHAVQHLPEQVKRFGPLWSISTFAFEGFNGHFSRFIKASKGALVQLGRRFALQQSAYKYLSQKVQKMEEPLASVVKELFPHLYQRWAPRMESNRYRLLNANTVCRGSNLLEFIQSRFRHCELGKFQFATRAACGSKVFHSSHHSSKTASVIKYSNWDDDLGESYGEVQLFFSVNGDIYSLVSKYRVLMPTNVLEVPPPKNALLYSLYDDRVYGSFFYIVEKTEELDAVLMFDVLCSAILIDCHGSCTVTDLLPFEHD